MAGLDKRVASYEAALEGLTDGMTLSLIHIFSDLRDDFGVTFLFISHDLGVVEHLCDDVAVMLSLIHILSPTRTILKFASWKAPCWHGR